MPETTRAFTFLLRDGTALLSIALPSTWSASTIGRLQAFIAEKRGLKGWACHFVTPRGPADELLLVRAAIVRGEEVVLARGPCPLHSEERAATRLTLWVWGRAVDGAVLPTPKALDLSPHRIRGVALGTEHALVVTSAGLVLAWGSNSHGQLGTGSDGIYDVARRPRVVQGLAAAHCTYVACGAHCSGAIGIFEGRADQLFTWGQHQSHNSPTLFETSWVNRHGATRCGRGARAVAFGGAHTLLLSARDGAEGEAGDDAGGGAGGVVWSWGYNESCQLGWAEAAGADRAALALRSGFQKPRAPLALGAAAVGVACGGAHSAALLAGGALLLWGDNARGQCGVGAGAAPLGRLVPVPERASVLEATEVVVGVQCCDGATLALLRSGRAYLIGGGRARQEAADDDDSDEDEGSEAEGGGAADEGDDEEAAPRPPEAASLAGVDEGRGGGGGVWARLGGLAEAKRLLAEGVRGAALSEDHALLLGGDEADDAVAVRGAGYNRYGQAAPGDERLRVPEPTPLPVGLLGGQLPVMVAVGGGGSAALTVAPETLAARCRVALRSELRAGNAACCAALLVMLARCEAPWLAPLAGCIGECADEKRSEVERACAAAGVGMDVALAALEGVSGI